MNPRSEAKKRGASVGHALGGAVMLAGLLGLTSPSAGTPARGGSGSMVPKEGSEVAASPRSVSDRGTAASASLERTNREREPLPLEKCATSAHLEVPAIRQAAERCGPAALAMVLQYYDAPTPAIREADKAYDPVLRGSLITDLAAAARRAGFRAVVATLTADSLIGLLQDGVPPIMLYQNGGGPMTVRHFGVVTRWDGARSTFALNDGSDRPRELGRPELIRRWSRAGSQALIVTRDVP